MIRLHHSSDWHITNDGQADEQAAVLSSMVEGQSPDAWLVAGDLFHHNLPHREPSAVEFLSAAMLLRLMASRAPVLVIYGNHDLARTLDFFQMMATAHPIYVVSRPKIVRLQIKTGTLNVVALPYPQKKFFVGARGVEALDLQRQEAGHLLETLIRQLCNEAAENGNPTVLLGHFNVAGSQVGGAEVLIGREIEVAPQLFDELPIVYGALGHIHKPQSFGRVWYSGAPKHFNFGDKGDRGWLDVKIDEDENGVTCALVGTKHRHMETIEAFAKPDGTWFLDGEAGAEGSDYRVIAHVPEDLKEAVNYAELEAIGKVERRVVPTTRVRCDSIVEAKGDGEKLRAYWSTVEPPPNKEDQDAAIEFHSELVQTTAVAEQQS